VLPSLDLGTEPCAVVSKVFHKDSCLLVLAELYQLSGLWLGPVTDITGE
jgi:hypothetical protein